MNKHDRAYLQDITQFISMNRVTSVYALYKALTELEDTAKFVVSKIWEEETSVDEIIRYGDTGRMQRILIAKIYVELISTYEDLGSLCDAIKNRNSQKRSGIFNRCAMGSTRQAAQFLIDVYRSDIFNHPELTLDILLQLPSITDLSSHLSQEMLHNLDEVYHEIPKRLYDVAAHYHAKRQEIAIIDTKDVPSSATNNDVNIFLGIIFPGDDTKGSSLNVDAFNKVKHMFLVTEDLSKYEDPSAAYKIEFARFGMTPNFVTLLMQNTIAAAQIMRILANVILHLDEAGVNL